ncbi:MAG: hypothetical protein ACK57T_05955 [Dolichospermum sp.]
MRISRQLKLFPVSCSLFPVPCSLFPPLTDNFFSKPYLLLFCVLGKS